jgi:hypothetical protein
LAFELAALIVTVGAKAKIQLFSWDTTQHSTLTSNLIFKDNNLSADYRNILARENFSLDLDQSFQVINRYGLNDQSSLVFDATLIEGETAYGVLRLPKNVQTSQSGLISELYLYQGKVDNSTRQITWNFKVNTHLGTGLYDRANIAGYDLIFNRPVIILHGINDDSEEFRSAIEASTSSSGKISANLASYSDRLYTLSNSQNHTVCGALCNIASQ